MKKIISVLLSAMLLSLLLTGCEPDGGESSAPESGAVSASTSSEPTASGEESAPAESPLDDFEFAENDTGITVVKYLGDDKDVVIPAQVNGKPVTVIGECSFEKMNIFSVTLPDTVTVIGEGAFGQCKELKDIDLPDSVTELQGGAFRESGLETITWSDNLQTIGYSCFANTNLREIMLPNQLTELLSGVFMECDNLEKVIFNEGLKLIEGYCFAGAGLKEIVLSSTVTELQEMSLACPELESVTLNEGLMRIDSYAFCSTKLTEIVIPSTVTQIYDDAFAHSIYMEKVMFEGYAPELFRVENAEPAGTFTVYYHEGAKGFTSPTWNGYKTEIW